MKKLILLSFLIATTCNCSAMFSRNTTFSHFPELQADIANENIKSLSMSLQDIANQAKMDEVQKQLPSDLSIEVTKLLDFLNRYSYELFVQTLSSDIYNYYNSNISDKELVKIFEDKIKQNIRDKKLMALFNNEKYINYIHCIIQQNIYKCYTLNINIEAIKNYKTLPYKEKVQFLLNKTNTIKNEFRRHYIIKLLYKHLFGRSKWCTIFEDYKSKIVYYNTLDGALALIDDYKYNYYYDSSTLKEHLDFNSDIIKSQYINNIIELIQNGYVTNPSVIEYITNINKIKNNYDMYLKEFENWSYEQLKQKYSQDIIENINSKKYDSVITEYFKNQLNKIANKTNKIMNTLCYDKHSVSLTTDIIHNNIYSIFTEQLIENISDKPDNVQAIQKATSNIQNNTRRAIINALLQQYLELNNYNNLGIRDYIFNCIKIRNDKNNTDGYKQLINYLALNNISNDMDALYLLVSRGYITNHYLINLFYEDGCTFSSLFKQLDKNTINKVDEYIAKNYNKCLQDFNTAFYKIIKNECEDVIEKINRSNCEVTIHNIVEKCKEKMIRQIDNARFNGDMTGLLRNYLLLTNEKYNAKIFEIITDNIYKILISKIQEQALSITELNNTSNSNNTTISNQQYQINYLNNLVNSLQTNVYYLQNAINSYNNMTRYGSILSNNTNTLSTLNSNVTNNETQQTGVNKYALYNSKDTSQNSISTTDSNNSNL